MAKLTEFPTLFQLEDPNDQFSRLIAGNAVPDGANPDGAITRVTSLPTFQNIKDEFLFGIPLVSTLTKQRLSDETITKKINAAISEFEAATQLYVQPVVKAYKFDYKYEDSLSFNPLTLPYRPIFAIEKLELQSGGTTFIQYPNSWVEITSPTQGFMRIVPLYGVYTSGLAITPTGGGNYSYLPNLLNNRGSWPNLWKITYTAGFQDGCVPYLIYELIGSYAAMHVLSMLGPIIFPNGATSLSLDGLAQSVSTPGPTWLVTRFNDLSARAAQLMEEVRRQYSSAFILDALG